MSMLVLSEQASTEDKVLASKNGEIIFLKSHMSWTSVLQEHMPSCVAIRNSIILPSVAMPLLHI